MLHVLFLSEVPIVEFQNFATYAAHLFYRILGSIFFVVCEGLFRPLVIKVLLLIKNKL